MSRPIWAGPAARVGAVVVAVAVLGAPLGLLWRALAPDVTVQVVPGGVVPTEAEPEGFFAGDGWFVLLGVAYGVLAAVGAWFLLRRHRGAVVLAALAVGAVGAGVLAWWIGHRIGLSGYRQQVRQAAPGTELHRPPELRARKLGLWFGFIPRIQGDLLVPAVAAAVAYTMLAAWSRNPWLRPGEPGERTTGPYPVGPQPPEAATAPYAVGPQPAEGAAGLSPGEAVGRPPADEQWRT